MIVPPNTQLPELKRGYKKQPPVFSTDERIGFSTLIHQIVLDEVGRVMVWRPGESALRGGGALHYGHGSARMSDDLNFLVADTRMAQLIKALPRILNRITGRLHEIAGGVAKVRRETTSGSLDLHVATVEITWTHPHRRGAVTVLVEFYPAPRASLDLYRAKPVLISLALVRSAGQMPVLVGTPLGLWADKVQAIANRATLKWRDLFDLGYILLNIKDFSIWSVADKLAALDTTAQIQGLALPDLIPALQQRLKLIKSALVLSADELNAYEADLQRWFDAELFAALHHSGMLKLHLETTLRELQIVIDKADSGATANNAPVVTKVPLLRMKKTSQTDVA
jgi:hypothetical protein